MKKDLFNYEKYIELFKLNPEKAFEYRDSFFTNKLTKDEVSKKLQEAGIKYSNRCKIETLLKIALDNNLI